MDTRSQKLFSKERWNECLASKDWSEIENCSNVDDMVEIFTTNVTEAMDETKPCIFNTNYTCIL